MFCIPLFFSYLCKNYELMDTHKKYERKEYEACQSFQEYVDELVRRTMRRIEEEMPVEGDFSDIFELFCNPDIDTSDIVGNYGLQVFKMPSKIVPDPKKRYVQACAYIPSGEYKVTLISCSGTKPEILALMNEQSYADKLNYTFGKLLRMVKDCL